MSRRRKLYSSSCEVSIVESVKLGGYQQKIAVEGRTKTLPIVICLHGGPGALSRKQALSVRNVMGKHTGVKGRDTGFQTHRRGGDLRADRYGPAAFGQHL